MKARTLMRNPQPLPHLLQAEQPQLDALPSLAQPLLHWYDRNKRDLPWRHSRDPYHIWVSEIMLQQTRVEAVKEYYRRFLEALPTVADLAAVPEDRLMKLWEGLGYYSRARNLQKAARVILAEHGGKLPASYAALLELPGIGEYTAGAVASIAFGIPVPAVDGNVYRVLSRVLCSYADTSTPAVKAAYRQVAQGMVPEDRPGDFNQALMELGATVCAPNGPPLCGECPLSAHCRAREQGCAAELPVKAAKKARRVEERTVILVIADQRLLLFRRENKGLLAGMHQPLNLEGHLEKAGAEATVTQLGSRVKRIIPLREAAHLFTHVEWRMKGYLVYADPFDTNGGIWADEAMLHGEIALPSAFSAYTGDVSHFLQGIGKDGTP